LALLLNSSQHTEPYDNVRWDDVYNVTTVKILRQNQGHFGKVIRFGVCSSSKATRENGGNGAATPAAHSPLGFGWHEGGKCGLGLAREIDGITRDNTGFYNV